MYSERDRNSATRSVLLPSRGTHFIVAIRKDDDVRFSEHEIRVRRRESNPRTIEGGGESARGSVLLPERDADLTAPLRAGHIATDDERDERPPLSLGRQNVKVVPLRPRIPVRNAVRGHVEAVDLVSQLEGCGAGPATVAVVVIPFPLHDFRRGTHCSGRRRNVPARVNRKFLTVSRAHVEQSSLDLRRNGRNLSSVPRRRHHLAVEKRRMSDREEETTDASRFHYLDIEPLREHGDGPAAYQLLVSRLRQHRFADREQHDHHRDAHAKAEEQKD